jgi:trigger factor
MQIEVNELEYCKVSVHYEADHDQIEAKRTEIVNAFKKAPVPGFRQGKASPEAIKMHYRSQIDESLKRALSEQAYFDSLSEKDLKPFGAPSFTGMFLVDGKFSCDFMLNLKPSFDLAPYAGMQIPKPEEKSVNEVVELTLQNLRVRHGESVPYTEEDFVQEGDSVIVSYKGFADGEIVDQICAEGESLVVGTSALQDFDSNLLGMKPGELRSFSMMAPSSSLPSLSGKEIKFEVTLMSGMKNIPCPLNDDFAKNFGKETFDELLQAVTDSSNARLAADLKKAINERISARLANDNMFKVPDWLSLMEAQNLVSGANMSWDSLKDEDREKYLDLAASNIRLSLVLDKIREAEPEAQLTDQEVFDMIRSNISRSNPKSSVDDVLKQLSQNGMLQMLLARIRDEHVLDFVSKKVTLTE